MDATKQTKEHIKTVGIQISKVMDELFHRSLNHDASKLKEPEKLLLDIYTHKLRGTTYGSTTYKQYLKELKPAQKSILFHRGKNTCRVC